jgi:beta-glucuronidase
VVAFEDVVRVEMRRLAAMQAVLAAAGGSAGASPSDRNEREAVSPVVPQPAVAARGVTAPGGRRLLGTMSLRQALIARDGHRPSVIAWSLANEPGYLAEPEYRRKSGPYWKDLFGHARDLDPTRPLTHANVGYAGLDDPAFEQADVVSINRYFGWYQATGQIDRAVEMLRADLDAVAVHSKPVFVAEFGADALAGQHSTSPQLFTEEYQADLIAAFWVEIERHPACIGGHVWNFADFRTAQHSRRVVLNLKGVFTRDRQPKRAAFVLRDLWKDRA